MEIEEIRRRAVELARSRPDPGGDVGALAEAALFMEEVFGISLSDDDMCEERLGTHRKIERYLLERLTPEHIERAVVSSRIAELSRSRPAAGDDIGALVEAALFIEEVFGLELSDEDIAKERLGTHEAMERFVSERLEL